MPNLHTNQSEQWKKVVYNSLTNMLTEVIFTKDNGLRQKLLEKTCKWYYEKVGKPAPKPVMKPAPSLQNFAPEPTPERLL
jgi:hypothetical protein